MSHLGSFGAAVRELDSSAPKDSFEFFGETFTVVGIIPPVLMLQLGAAATGKIEDQEGLAALWEAMRCSLNADEDGKDFDRLYKLAVRHRCDLEELMKLAMALFEAQAGRPTGGPSGSSLGASTTSPSSNTSSSPSQVSELPGMTSVSRVLDGSAESRPA